jgi:hypothetical protein
MTSKRRSTSVVDPLKRYGVLEWHPASVLQVDEAYQRPTSSGRVKGMAADYEPRAIRPLDVSRRRDGSLWILDGRHRLEATVLYYGDPNVLVPCWVRSGLTVPEEASIFVMMNRGARQPNPVQVYRASLTAEDPPVVAIERVVRRAGFVVDAKRGEGVISAVVKLYRLHEWNVLAETLDVIVDAWGRTPDAVRDDILLGVGAVIRTDVNKAQDPIGETKRLVRVLAEYDVIGRQRKTPVPGPALLWDLARDRKIKMQQRYNVSRTVTEEILGRMDLDRRKAAA